jgi:hypothetical protein
MDRLDRLYVYLCATVAKDHRLMDCGAPLPIAKYGVCSRKLG